MDSRVSVSETSEGFFALGTNYQTREAMEQGVAETISRREKIASRQLTAAELQRGVNREDDRDIRQRMADENWQPTLSAAKDTGEQNPYRRALDDGSYDPRPAKPVNRKEMYKQAAEEWDRAEAAKAEKAAFDANPIRMKAIEAAERHLERIMFDPSQVQSAVNRAQQLVRQAREGDLVVFRDRFNEEQAALRQQADERRAKYDEQITQLMEQRDGLADFETTERKPLVWYPPEYVGPVPPEERARANAEYLDAKRLG